MENIKQHAVSILNTFLAVFSGFIIIDAYEPLSELFKGNILSETIWVALGFAILRSIIKSLIVTSLPALKDNLVKKV